MSVTIRIPEETHKLARRLASENNQTIGEVIAAALARYEEEQWWAAVDAAYARARADPIARAEDEAEMALWDTALMDGLDEWPYEGIEELLAAGDQETTP
jgi:predicted transcriptional regulator